jgi:tetratricopeptide (TPR) repeat protein
MLLLDVWPLGRTKWFPPELPDLQTQPLSVWSLVMEKIPFFTLSVLDSFIALRTQAIFGARPDLQLLPISNRIATALVGYVKYAGILFWPRNLAAYYPYQMNLPPSAAVASAILLLTITAVTIGLRKHRPYLMVGWCWFIIALMPVCGLFQAGDQALADRFTYLPSMGLTVAVVWLMAGDARTRQYISLKVSAMMCGTVAVLACAVLSRGYLYNWSDTITLFTHAAEVNAQPDSRIELLLGDAYTAAHRPDVAIDHYVRSLQLNPSSSAAHVNLANLLLPYSPRMALPHYRAAVELKPNSSIDHYDYAVCLQALGRRPEADREFAEARRLRLIAPQ